MYIYRHWLVGKYNSCSSHHHPDGWMDFMEGSYGEFMDGWFGMEILLKRMVYRMLGFMEWKIP